MGRRHRLGLIRRPIIRDRIPSGNVVLVASSFITATGGTITTDGNYKVHTFTASGTFEVTSGSGNIWYLVVAGGAAGGWVNNTASSFGGGGGGAGGYKSNAAYDYAVTAQAYTVTVGVGGIATSSSAASGGNSVFDTVTSTGGGAGAEGR